MTFLYKLILLGLFFVSCTNRENVREGKIQHVAKLNEISVEMREFVNVTDSGFVVDFRKIGLFDTLFIYGPFHDLETIEKQFQASFYFKRLNRDYIDDGECLVVFKGKALDRKCLFIKRDVDLSRLSNRCYNFEQSTIIVARK